MSDYPTINVEMINALPSCKEAVEKDVIEAIKDWLESNELEDEYDVLDNHDMYEAIEADYIAESQTPIYNYVLNCAYWLDTDEIDDHLEDMGIDTRTEGDIMTGIASILQQHAQEVINENLSELVDDYLETLESEEEEE